MVPDRPPLGYSSATKWLYFSSRSPPCRALRRRTSERRMSCSFDADPRLKHAPVRVLLPEDLGDVVGLVVGARRDLAADSGMRDVNAAVIDLVVQHPRVGDLAGERDAHAGPQRVRVDRRAAGSEEDRARAALEH